MNQKQTDLPDNHQALAAQKVLQIEKLWQCYEQTRDQACRNDLLMHYIDLVKRVVNRLYPSTQYYHDYDDLISTGVVGLIDAFERFDRSRNIKFETYAQIRIRGEIIDYMRRQDFAPTHLRLKIRMVERAIDTLSQKLGRMPADQELADHLNLDLHDLQNILGEAHCLNVLHLDELLGTAQDDGLDIAEDNPSDLAYEKKEVWRILREEISHLSEKEQLVLALYYEEELTLKEIGHVLKLTESRISQIHSSALVKLKTRIGKLMRVDSPPIAPRRIAKTAVRT